MTDAPPFCVLAVDNLDVIRYGLLSLPTIRPDAVAAIEVHPDISALALDGEPPDVLVLDYWLGHEDRPVIDDLARLSRWAPAVLLYTSEERPARLRAAMQAGVDGLCLKTDGLQALADAILMVGSGRPVFSGPWAQTLLDDEALGARLTPREVEILQGLAMGLTVAEIARELVLSEKTVDSHSENIRRKYSPHGERVNRARMVHEGLRDGYLDDPFRQPRPPTA